MRIAHFCPFAPHQCGMYETARDMIMAERKLGHQVEFVDTGVGKKRKVGFSDRRVTGTVATVDYKAVKDFDLFVVNCNIPDSFLAETEAPVVQILHGRPLASFRSSQRDPSAPVYRIMAERVRDERFRLFLSLWPEHLRYWRVLIPEERLASVSAPPCDLDLYGVDGPRHAWEPRGFLNVLVADMWRQDTDPFELVHDLMETDLQDMRIHFYGCQEPLGPWEHIFRHLRKRGLLGETKGMMLHFSEVLRAADVVVTGNRIATRVLREALAVGTPVVAPAGCRHTRWTWEPGDGADLEMAIAAAWGRDDARLSATAFDLERIGPELLACYERAVVPQEVGRGV